MPARAGLTEPVKEGSTCYLKRPLMDALCPHLKQGIESIDQIASLCQSDLEAVRTAAREATLSFGKVQHRMGFQATLGRLREKVQGRPSKMAHRLGALSDPFNCIWPRQVSFTVEVARSALFLS